MNKWIIALLLSAGTSSLAGIVELTVEPRPILEEADRIGINLGTWTTWGAEQLSKNILMNPGFEGYVDRITVIVTKADKSSFYDEPDWGYDDDYWKGATFDVRTGAAKGTIGKITHSLRKGPGGAPQYVTEKPLPLLDKRDVVVLTKQEGGDPLPLWWIDKDASSSVHVDTVERRPLSSGTQSLILEPKGDMPAAVNYYLDAISDRAGKLLAVNGPWRLSFWARTDTPEDTIQVMFRRINGTPPFLEKNVSLTEEWKEYTFDFDARDGGDPQTLQLKIAAVGSKGKVWIDDAVLGPVQPDNPTSFRQEVVELLKKLRPSYIRDTQGQLGDTFQNRIADIYARKAITTRAFAGAPSRSTGYSIPDLLDLCRTVGANPWIVVPPTFSDEEAFLLGQYLAKHAPKTVFSTVIVEFGNENWNWLFRATGIPYPQQHGQVADSIFHQLAQGAGSDVNLRKVVNGQHATPRVSKEFFQSLPGADAVAIAPYFFRVLNEGGAQEQNLKEMFSDDLLTRQLAALMEQPTKQLAAYEVNLHTTLGSAQEDERLRYTVGQAAGSALAKRLVEGMLLGVHPEIVFSLAQFDVDTESHKGKARLWGIVRNLNAPVHLRPQGLAVEMLNRVIGGALHSVKGNEGTGLTAAAFLQAGQWKAAAINGGPVEATAAITFPEGKVPTKLWVLHAASPFDTNEVKEEVTITQQQLHADGQKVSFTVPAWGFVVLNAEEHTP